jgi:hypothetical protein
MEMTVYDMERPAAMPTAAHVAVASVRLTVPTQYPAHGTAAPFGMGIAVKPWTTGNDHQVERLSGLAMADRSTRRLGRTST